MKKQIKLFEFKSSDGAIELEVPFDNEAYINATEVYKKFEKSKTSFNNWKQRTLVPYAEKLIQLGKFVGPQNGDAQTIDDVIVVRSGNSSSFEQGTWFHPKLAIVFARWLNMEFEIWCDEKIAELINFGVSKLDPDDIKYVMLMADVLDNYTPNTRSWTKAIRALLTIHEEQGYNIKTFEELLFQVSKQANKYDRVAVYEKISSVIDSMYKDGEMDMTTRERMKSSCDAKIITILKVRVTRAENKLRKSFSLQVENKEAHDKIVAINSELEKANADLEAVTTKDLGVVRTGDKTDAGLIAIDLTTKNIIADLRAATDFIEDKEFRIIYQGFLTPNERKIEGDKLPTFSGEYTIPGKGRIGCGIWPNHKYNYLQLSKYGVDGNYLKILQLDLLPTKADPDTYRSFNKNGTLCAVYNQPTNCVLVYAVKVSST